MPFVSIIVPVFNVEQYLSRCIDSILTQTFTDFELLLIDDGSPDNCGMICDEYAAKDNRIRVFHKENGGVSCARNIGLDNAKGEFIGFVDSDDVIHPQFLEALLTNSDSYDVIFCDYEQFSENIEFGTIEEIKSSPVEDFVQQSGSYTVIWNKLYQREIIDNIRFKDICNGEDTLWGFMVAKKANRILHVNEILYGYYQRAGSASKRNSLQKYKDFCVVWSEIYRLESEGKYSKKFKHHWLDSIINLFYCAKSYKNKQECKYCRDIIMRNFPFIFFTHFGGYTVKDKIALLYHIFIK